MISSFLFLIYFNNILESLEHQIILFADDTFLFETVECDLCSPSISLTNDMAKIKLWPEQWLVSFNPRKAVNVK